MSKDNDRWSEATKRSNLRWRILALLEHSIVSGENVIKEIQSQYSSYTSKEIDDELRRLSDEGMITYKHRKLGEN